MREWYKKIKQNKDKIKIKHNNNDKNQKITRRIYNQ